MLGARAQLLPQEEPSTQTCGGGLPGTAPAGLPWSPSPNPGATGSPARGGWSSTRPPAWAITLDHFCQGLAGSTRPAGVSSGLGSAQKGSRGAGHFLARDPSASSSILRGQSPGDLPAHGEALLTPWARSPGAPPGQKAGRPRTPPAFCLLLCGIDADFLFVFVIRGESALIYIKW